MWRLWTLKMPGEISTAGSLPLDRAEPSGTCRARDFHGFEHPRSRKSRSCPERFGCPLLAKPFSVRGFLERRAEGSCRGDVRISAIELEAPQPSGAWHAARRPASKRLRWHRPKLRETCYPAMSSTLFGG